MPNITCGNCKAQHPTVADVRACYGQQKPVAAQAQPTANRPVAQPTAAAAEPFVPATVAQQSYIEGLRTKKGLEPLAFTGSKREASAEIKRLINLPVVAPVAVATTPSALSSQPTVPAGRYAIEAEGVVKFYRVDCPTEGLWAGRTFVKVQASDDLHAVRGASATAVLEAIATDPAAASLRYGVLLGHCGVCGRTLTDAESRARGIGPVCASKTGW